MIAARRASLAALLLVLCAAVVPAQGGEPRQWNDSASQALVSRAIARRSAQLADTALADYKAIARGYLTFFAQLGEGYPDPPRVVRADELAVEVLWRAPNQSKQRVIGRRDTLLLPTDLSYHRDHLGVVQNNFPAIIRLGDGDEVRDVPHPLSAVGRDAYDFLITDSLAIRVSGRSWEVVAVDIRPRDDRQPRVVGTAYIDRESGSVVRMNLTFTRAALIDSALEDISVSLDNGLVDGRFWLPRRQEIEIRRTGKWLDFPARGIIRGEWDLCCIEPNRGLPGELFVGPEITVAPAAELARYPFTGSLGDSLQARVIGAGAERPAAALQQRALGLVRAEALARTSRAAAAASSVSDFVRVNRVEGLALGMGLSWLGTAATELRLEGRYGLDDALLKYRVNLSARSLLTSRVSLFLFDEYRDARVAPEMSRLGNSFGAAEFGSDFTDEYRVSGAGVSVAVGQRWRWRFEAERVRERALAVHATPFTGSFRPAFPADAWSGSRASIFLSSPLIRRFAGTEMRGSGRVTVTWPGDLSMSNDAKSSRFERLALSFDARRPVEMGELVVNTRFLKADAKAPAQAYAIVGGPSSAPGYPAGSLRQAQSATVRAEWRVPVTAFSVSLGRFGRPRVPVILAPFVHGAWLSPEPIRAGRSFHRSVGLGVITAHELLRLDLARGVDGPGGWAIYADFGRAFWPIL